MIDKVKAWLEGEPEGGKVFSYVGLYIVLAFIVSISILGFFIAVHAPIVNQTVTSEEMKSLGPIMMWPVLVLVAVIEELIFRLAPLAVALFFFRRRPIPLLAIALAVSVCFGFFHGNYLNIFMQGTSGFLLSLLFLKCGGFNGHIVKAFGTSSLAHFLFNGIVFLPIFLAQLFPHL